MVTSHSDFTVNFYLQENLNVFAKYETGIRPSQSIEDPAGDDASH